MTTDTALVAAALRRLAEAEEACPGKNGFPYRDWHRRAELDNVYVPQCCHGTGRIPLFRDAKGKALFRKACHHIRDSIPGFCEPPCKTWELLDVAEVHGETLLLFAANNRHQSLADGQVFRLIMDAWERAALTASTEEAFIEAAIRALDAAVAART